MTPATRALTVAFLIDRWEPERGGAERALAELARHLERRGQRVLAFARRASEGAPGEFRAVAAGGWSRANRERELARELVRAAEAAGADVTIGIRHLESVDVFWPHAGAHARGLEARERARRRAPAAAEGGPAGRHALFIELERQLCAHGGARRIVCVSQLVADELGELYPEARERLELVENGIDLERFSLAARAERGASLRARLRIPATAGVIAFLAHDAELKGLPALLEAVALLGRSDVHLLIGGARELARWKQRAGRASAPERVHAFETLDAAEALSAADVLAHPTWRDTAGLVLLEAQAVGTPVVTTRCAGDAVTVREGTSGTVLEDPGDVASLARALGFWLDRSRAHGIRRSDVRAAVLHRGLARWLDSMERIVLSASASSRC